MLTVFNLLPGQMPPDLFSFPHILLSNANEDIKNILSVSFDFTYDLSLWVTEKEHLQWQNKCIFMSKVKNSNAFFQLVLENFLIGHFSILDQKKKHDCLANTY